MLCFKSFCDIFKLKGAIRIIAFLIVRYEM